MASARPPGKDFAYIAIIVVLFAVLMYFLLQSSLVMSSQQAVVDNIQKAYETLTENDVEILNVKDEGHMYKIMMRLKLASGDVVREVYATKDGKFFSEAGNIIEVSGLMETLGKDKAFAECLREKNFLVFGQRSEINTYQQLLVIGNFANKVYVDCVDANLQACLQLGIQSIPTIVYEQQNYTGLKTRDWIETLTGCEY